MVWGCFMGNKIGPIVFVDESIKKEVYVSVLEQNLLEFIDVLKEDGVDGMIFQQDNARPYAAKYTLDWLEIAGREHGFTVMQWPANSPDMNPIENLWAILKRELHQRYPDTKYLKGSPSTIKASLKARLMDVWWDIGGDMLERLIESMPLRVAELR